jgi:3-hydroxyacyl-CoA dehydrogenase/enoyl-CoA hydratase/3-hydroxybutyryl-CoA epimerase
MQGVTVTFRDEVATVTLSQPGKVNKLGPELLALFERGMAEALAHPGLKGVILASGHKDFCVGADIEMLYPERDPAKVLAMCRALHALTRKLETGGVPVVAALTGTALGGGYELALACHHRVALDDPKVQIGLPETRLGVIPGGGGTQRLPYIMGLQAAMEHMALGEPVRAPKAKAMGMVEALAPDREAVLAQAHAWILANPKPSQPWDQRRWTWPGGVRPNTAEAMQLFVGAAAFLVKKTAGAFPAAEAVIRAVSEGTRLQFDRALEVEARLFARLATSDQAKDMIRTLWFHRTAAEKLGVGVAHGFGKVTILGAGMMGAGLGFLAAKAGCQVVIKDIKEPQLAAARAHCEQEARKLKHLGQAGQDEILARLSYTTELEALRGSDLVIEAIVENLRLKHAVIREVEPLLAEGGVFASNTSAIPIARLAEAAIHKDRFVGMHFFSPVEKMPLLEVIQPPGCSDEAVQRALGFGKALGKTNIVVNDGYGFFTTRLFAAYLLEGCQLAAEGHDPALIEYAARVSGMVMPPLKVFDEVTLTLGMHAFDTRQDVTGEGFDLEGLALVRQLVAMGRTGKAVGQGFYDWEARTMWAGLRELVTRRPEVTGLEHLGRRLMLIQAAEVGRVLDDGIIRDLKDVEVGAIFGLGFAPNTGGPLAWMDRQGLPRLVAELETMAQTYGARYAPSPYLRAMAAEGRRFWPSEA